jgi:hypothetical protein
MPGPAFRRRPAPACPGADFGDWQNRAKHARRDVEELMSRPRAADDFATIRARLEELRREKTPAPPAPAGRAGGHRGPCACGLSLFADECDGSCKAL